VALRPNPLFAPLAFGPFPRRGLAGEALTEAAGFAAARGIPRRVPPIVSGLVALLVAGVGICPGSSSSHFVPATLRSADRRAAGICSGLRYPLVFVGKEARWRFGWIAVVAVAIFF
jgi:hypothetical protein